MLSMQSIDFHLPTQPPAHLLTTSLLWYAHRWSGYVKKYRHQFAKDPNIDLTKVRAASLTSDAEAAIICPVRHTHMHACMHAYTDIGRLICWTLSK